VDKLVEFKWAKYGRAAFHGKLAGAVAFAGLLCVMTVAGHEGALLHALAHKAARLVAAWLYLPDLRAWSGTAPRGASSAASVAVVRELHQALKLAGKIARDAFVAPAPAPVAGSAATATAPSETLASREALYAQFHRLLAAPTGAGWEQVRTRS
jgi:hypothetical protein